MKYLCHGTTQSLHAQVEILDLHKNHHLKKMGSMMVFTIHTPMTKTQVVISIEINSLNKVIYVHGY
jgi:hypothetical protein